MTINGLGLILAALVVVVTGDDALPVCPPQTDNVTYYFPNPHNCSTYYTCSNSVPILQSCPPSLHFSPALNTCAFPEDANCVEVPISLIYPFNCIQPIMPNPLSCYSFLHCQASDTAIIEPCPEPLMFHPQILVCDWPNNVNCPSHEQL